MSTPNNTQINTETNVWTIQTVQISALRTTFSALKDILIESNLSIQPDGIRIISMDQSHTILVHMYLAAQKFELYKYNCTKPKILFGVNLTHLYKLINSIEADDTLTMYIENCDYNDGIVSYLTLRFENIVISQCKTIKLKVFDDDAIELTYPNVKFSSIINMPSQDFQKIIKDMTLISKKIEIQSVGNELIFKAKGDFANVTIVRHEGVMENGESTMMFQNRQEPSKIIHGEFSLKYLGYFIKCTNLCPSIEIYLENNLPFIVKYSVADLGELQLCLAPLPNIS